VTGEDALPDDALAESVVHAPQTGVAEGVDCATSDTGEVLGIKREPNLRFCDDMFV
jgi:hypothetical protein